MLKAITCSVGPMAFGSAWRHSTARSDKPLSRAIST